MHWTPSMPRCVFWILVLKVYKKKGQHVRGQFFQGEQLSQGVKGFGFFRFIWDNGMAVYSAAFSAVRFFLVLLQDVIARR